MSIAEKLTIIAENEQRVYDSGVEQGEGNVWDIIQGVGGTRTIYDFGFKAWQTEYIRPKYKVVPKRATDSNLRFVFEYSKVKKLESKYFDFSNISFNANATNTQSLYGFFRSCSELEEIEDIGLGAGGYYNTFNKCEKLHTIAVMRCVKEGTYQAPFTNCYALKNITIEGVIGNDITFKDSSELTIESLRSIFSALYDFVGNGETTTRTITLHKDAYVRTPEEVIEEAKGKGWSVVVA